MVVILGAGAAGLAVSATLKARGVGSVVLESGDGVATSWRNRYDRLKLHTTRHLSSLPGMPIPREYGRWVRRDDLVRYLDAYARRFDLDVRTGVTVTKVVRDGDGWSVRLADGAVMPARTVVVATGNMRIPVIPDWPGTFDGTLLHSSDYRNAEPFRGQDVLVVGTGNSGAEIASDLAEGGAASVSLAVRTPPHIVRRNTGPWTAQMNGIVTNGLPGPLLNRMGAALARITVPDLTPYGLPRPSEGIHTRLVRDRNVPLQDVGIVSDIQAGRVKPVAAVQGFDGKAVLLADGTSLTPQTVVAATGYHSGLRDLVDDPSLFDAAGVPLARGGKAAAPGLYFVGYQVTLNGALLDMIAEARVVAHALGRA
jgi:putative flavoprotein involved in K+ transport